MKTLENALLAPYTSLKVGGPAKKLIELGDQDNLKQVVSDASEKGQVWVLGYGTNCLISDNGLRGTVILNKAGDIKDLGSGKFKVDAGVSWDDFIQLLIQKGYWGLEFTSGIPGGTGAAIAGNIAAYGHKVADRFVEATVLDTEDGTIKTWRKEDFDFDYRSSVMQKPENKKFVILDGTFQLSRKPTGELEYASALKVADELSVKPDSLKNRRKIIMETRNRVGSLLQDKTKGPWTAGSFFKNPMASEEQAQKIIDHEEASITRDQLYRQNQIHGQNMMRVSAAHVLLAAGFKRGQTWDNVRLHPDHILKIENIGDAKAQEIYDVVQEILRTVKEKIGIELEPEVRFLGHF